MADKYVPFSTDSEILNQLRRHSINLHARPVTGPVLSSLF